MAAYKINGNELTLANYCAPASHSIAPAEAQIVKTLGGVVLVQPPDGQRRVHVWTYDQRPTKAVRRLRQFLALDTSPVVTIDTYDVTQNDDETFPLLTNLVCTCSFPEIKSAERRDWVEGFTLTFQELYVQS